ncbi:MAG: glycine--tRNA ligase subunit beta, partial [Gammaproteobacteria bacterium]
MEATLLVELLTEELPPKSLRLLGEHLASALAADLHKSGFMAEPGAAAFATPRRLAVRLAKVRERSPDVAKEVQGPPVTAAPQAVAGFA